MGGPSFSAAPAPAPRGGLASGRSRARPGRPAATLRRPPAAAGRVLVPACLALAAACVVVDGEVGRPRAASAASVAAGMSRAEVLARLGPPDEYATPVPLFGVRAWDPGTLRVLEEHELFDRRTWTWTAEVEHDRAFIIPLVFLWWRTTHRADRLRVEFDAGGRVVSVAGETVEAGA